VIIQDFRNLKESCHFNAVITLEANLGLRPDDAAATCIKPMDSSKYEGARAGIEDLLRPRLRRQVQNTRSIDEFNQPFVTLSEQASQSAQIYRLNNLPQWITSLAEIAWNSWNIEMVIARAGRGSQGCIKHNIYIFVDCRILLVMFCSNLILSHKLISSSPVARRYLQDCADQHAKLALISNHVEIGLCTCAWLMG
jgi:hypothetical protein